MLCDKVLLGILLTLSSMAAGRESDTDPAADQRFAGSSASESAVPWAVAGRAGWQSVPDPPPDSWSIPAQRSIQIPLPPGTSPDQLLWPAVPGPCVAWRETPGSTSLHVWDLRSGRPIGQVRAALRGAGRWALSPDGELLAVLAEPEAGKVTLWSCRSGQPVREIALPEPFSLVYGLDFAGLNRLVITLATEKMMGVWEPASGRLVARIPLNPPPQLQDYAFSPGGHYVAVARSRTQRIELYDLRNGVFAGEVPLRIGPPSPQPTGTGPTPPYRGEARMNLVAVEFAGDGSELAAVVRRGDWDSLLCWSMAGGALTAEHDLNTPFRPRQPEASATRSMAIDFLPSRRGWLLAGSLLVDRRLGGPTLLSDHSRSTYPAWRRVLDDSRWLVSAGDTRQITLESVPIPWVAMNASRSAGTTRELPQDAGLPPLTRAERSGAGTIPLGLPTGAYAPHPTGARLDLARAGPLLIDTSLSPIRQVLVAGTASPRLVVNCDPANLAERPPGLSGSFAGPFTDVYDLRTGKFEGRFVVPHAAELLDVSPSGTVGVFREAREKNRLDLFRLADGEHVVGFCPEEGGTAYERQVAWAALVDDDHLMTHSSSGRVTLWSLAGCRAVYSLAASPNGRIVLDRNRDHYLAVRDGTAYIVASHSGQVCQRLTWSESERQPLLSAAAWSEDGSRLAASLATDSESRVIAWELAGGKLLCDVPLPSTAVQLSWTGPSHLALHKTQTDQERLGFGPRQVSILDVQQGRVVWQYQLDPPAFPFSGPDDRLWFAAPVQGVSTVGLAALPLPGAEEIRSIRASLPHQPVLARGARVRLEVTAAGLPADLPDRRQREERLVRLLTERFTESLQARGVVLDDQSAVRLSVAIQSPPQGPSNEVRSSQRFVQASTATPPPATVSCRLAIDVGREQMLWERTEFVDAGQVDARSVPEGLSRSTWTQLRQWDKATRWCLQTGLPIAWDHPEAQRGLGESRLTLAGPQFLRGYEPARE